MAQTFVVSVNGGTGTTAPFLVNPHLSPVNMGVVVYQSGSPGTGMYIVQHTFDSPFDRHPLTGALIYANMTAFVSAARWINHPTLSSLTSTSDSNYAYPPAAIRLNVVSAGVTTNFEMRIIQAGIAGN